MAKLIMLRGLPASGKSTKAKELMKEYGNFVRVNRDLLREMLHFGSWTGKNEGQTIRAQMDIVWSFLERNENVIIDDCNLGDQHKQRWEGVARETKAKFEVVDVPTSYIECQFRDRERQNKVGKSVIASMALQYGKFPKDLPIVICDLDGTLCDISHRLHFTKTDPKDWKGFFAGISGDILREEVLWKLTHVEPAYRILVSARPDNYRRETEEWLEKYGIAYEALIMRRAGDRRPDVDVKGDVYDRFFKAYKVVKVFDDRPSVIRMWREKGLEVEDVGSGVEF